MALDDYFKQQATNAIRDSRLLVQDAVADIGNTYRAVLMQHTGWITSGRYHHMDASHDIAQQGVSGPEGGSPQIGFDGIETPKPGIGGRVHMYEIRSPLEKPGGGETGPHPERGPPEKNFTSYMGPGSYSGPGAPPPTPEPDEPEPEP
jgi:hypothetical protein